MNNTSSLISLKKNPLFAGLNEFDIKKLSSCLSADEKTFSRDSFVFRAGSDIGNVYLIISGSMHIISEDFWGNRTIIETIEKNTLFGEAYALSSRNKYLVSVIAAENSVVFEIDSSRLFKACPKMCDCHVLVIENIMHILSEKIVKLTEKDGHLSQRTTREKILSYLSKCALQSQSDAFSIPYSRQQLADYLCVDRSALSHELGKLRALGILEYNKNNFRLLPDNNKFAL